MNAGRPWLVLMIQWGIIATVAGLWEISGRLKWVDQDFLPSLSKVLETLWRLLQTPRFQTDIQVTVIEIAVAFLIVAPLGIIMGFFIGERRALHRVVEPTLQFLMATPKALFLPIFILAFGIGYLQKIMFAVTLGLFAVIMSSVAAVQSTPYGLISVARSSGATRAQIYRHIYLPAMMPLIVEGLRLGLIFTIFGVLLSEMYGASRGLGRVIVAWGEEYRMAELLAAVLLVVVMTVVLNEAMRFIEMRSLKRRGS